MKMTLWGINEYLDKTLFDFLPDVLPAGTYDAATLEELIFIECGDLFPYYQVPSYLKAQCRNFFVRNAEQFKRAWEALYSDYNPIENYDRQEAWSDSHSSSESISESLSSSESVHASTSSSDSTSSSSAGDVSAYNSPTLQPQSASRGNAATSGHNTNDTNGNSHSSRLHTDGRLALDRHEGRVHGNIGVITTQQMIQSSLDLANYDIYLWVVTVFRKNIISSIV